MELWSGMDMAGRPGRVALRSPAIILLSILSFFPAAVAYGQAPDSPAFQRLHRDLQLTASQEDGWRSFQQAYAVDPQEFAKRRTAESSMANLAAPQRVDLAVNLAKADLADLQRRGTALKAFYASLSPEQQHIFDRDTAPPTPGGNRPE